DFGKSLLRSFKIGGRNQEVEIRKTSQPEIAVNGLRQRRPFVRDRAQLPAFEVLHNARQFGAEPQAAAQVRLIRRSQRALNFRGKPASMFDQVAGREWKDSMVLRQAKNFAPVEF